MAWVAGIFEGEGWIAIQGKAPQVGIQMGDVEVLRRVQDVLDMGHIHPRSIGNLKRDGVKSRKPRWTWRVTSFELVQATIAFLWPWLSERRRKRAKEVLSIAKTARASSRRAYKRIPTADLCRYLENRLSSERQSQQTEATDVYDSTSGSDSVVDSTHHDG